MNLSEAWKQSYREYLKETENSIDSTLTELLEANKEISQGFEYLAEYYSSLDEAVTDNTEPTQRERDVNVDVTSYLLKQLGTKILAAEDEKERDIPEYKAVQGISTVERLSDMKFPKNIIFFIQQVIQWIKRVVVYFIEKIKNVFRALTGSEIKQLDPEALKLKFERAKKLETIDSFRVDPNDKPQIVRAISVKADDVKPYYALRDVALKEDQAIDEGLLGSLLGLDDAVKDVVKSEKPGDKKSPVVVTIDLSKDLMTLKQLVQHFYDLYDGAFGSNNEKLFAGDDLALILEIFKKTIDDIKHGEATTAEIGSYAVEVSAIDAVRVKDNLIRTNTNIENLKAAYQQTASRTKDIARIITHKEMLMLSGYGVDTKWLSSSTYQQMIEIMSTLKPRLKDAEKNEKTLQKIKKQYEKVADQLLKMQSSFSALGNISYSTVYQRRLVDLCNAARYMSQIVTLRLTGLGLYIKEMKDIKDILGALININKQ